MKKYILLGIIVVLIAGTFLYMFRFKLEVKVSDITISFGEEVNLKDYIEESNVEFLDKIVSFYELGEKDVNITYKRKDKTYSYPLKVNVVDTDSPFILGGSKTIFQGDDIDLTKGVICADYVSSNVSCNVIGEYDINTIGTYELQYEAIDESGNKALKDFNLYVIKKTNSSSSNTQTKKTYFEDIKDMYASSNVLVGIDVSKFQGEIDFEKVRDAGASFVIIRMGWDVSDEIGLDYRFTENIKKAYEAGLKIGLYFYSEAKNITDIEKEVEFIKENIKYPIDLPIAYDWEDFSYFNTYKLSIYDFNNLAYTFIDKLNEAGYKASLYGSAYYLENMWIPKEYPVWVAQYYKEVTYEGPYYMWQICDTGRIDGIDGAVDIDLLYLSD